MTFSVFRDLSGLSEVCRFYAPGVHSHFFTLDPAECALLKTPGSGWIYEGIAFVVAAPAGGSCPITFTYSGIRQAIYRLYNNRSAFGDTTHRYTHDLDVRQALVDRGWISEGIAFCVVNAVTSNPTYQIETSKVLASEECENESLNLGACVGLNHTIGMPYQISSSSDARPVPLARTTTYLTGGGGDVKTSVNSNYIGDVTEHSFVVVPPALSGVFHRIYVNSRDRTGSSTFPVMSINPLYQFLTTQPTGN